MMYLRLGWVACGGIQFRDDSPFAYILSGCYLGFLGRNFFCGWFARELGVQVGLYTYIMNEASTAGLSRCIYIALL